AAKVSESFGRFVEVVACPEYRWTREEAPSVSPWVRIESLPEPARRLVTVARSPLATLNVFTVFATTVPVPVRTGVREASGVAPEIVLQVCVAQFASSEVGRIFTDHWSVEVFENVVLPVR